MRLKISLWVLIVVALLAWPEAARGQDDSPQADSPSLGDVARNLRKSKAQPAPTQQAPDAPYTVAAPARSVIDNDNLAQAIEDAKKAKPAVEAKTVLSIDPSGNTLRVSSPDATCSLSFNARASSLLVKPVLVETLPLDQLVKLDGPGSITEDKLQLDLFNGTEWDLREVTVGLTLERRPGYNAEVAARARVLPASKMGGAPALERRSDVTLLYHLKTETKAFSTAAIREKIGITPAPDEDWRWSIVEAKGIRPAGARVAPESLSQPLNTRPADPPAPR